jgi:predicted short-subunit dehydrogenase-like oxidoreductase (DUF2520 family)
MNAHSKSELRPFIPLLIGQGKLARHLSFYLTQKKIAHEHWPDGRNLTAPALKPLFAKSSCVWILVTDRAISELSTQLRELAPALPQIHSSAASEIPGTLTLHPLQTFGPDLYTLNEYEVVPLTYIKEEWSNHAGLKASIQSLILNPSFEISKSDRALYHAYCVMMANFPQLLWTQVTDESNVSIGLERAAFAPILNQATKNFLNLGRAALTGPLIRGDLMTIQRHENALAKSKLLNLYQSFVTTFKQNTSNASLQSPLKRSSS